MPDIDLPPGIIDILPNPDIYPPTIELPQPGEGGKGDECKGQKEGTKDEGERYKKEGDKSKKQKEKEKKKRKETIKEHWKYYRNPRDPYDKDYKRREIRDLIREYRRRFGRM